MFVSHLEHVNFFKCQLGIYLKNLMFNLFNKKRIIDVSLSPFSFFELASILTDDSAPYRTRTYDPSLMRASL